MKSQRPAAIVAIFLTATALGCRPETAEETRSEGELAFKRNCQKCHSLPKPTKYTDAQWPPLVERYGARAMLSDSVIAQITLYLTLHN
jgi:cytochrome c5